MVEYFGLVLPVNEFRLEREAYVGDTAITKKQANFTISNLHEIDPHNGILMPQSTGSRIAGFARWRGVCQE